MIVFPCCERGEDAKTRKQQKGRQVRKVFATLMMLDDAVMCMFELCDCGN